MLLGWYGYLSLISLLLWDTLQSHEFYHEKVDEPELQTILSSSLRKRCIETDIDEFQTSFAICFMNGVILNQYTVADRHIPVESSVWAFETPRDSSLVEQTYTKTHICEDENGNAFNESKVIVRMECCRTFIPQHHHHYFISPLARNVTRDEFSAQNDLMVREVMNLGCETHITVCSALICKANNTLSSSSWQTKSKPNLQDSEVASLGKRVEPKIPWQFGNMSPKEQREQLEKVYDIFHHAYQSYMNHGFPKGELRPISCEGGNFDLIKIPLVTLIDTLDTLVVVHDFEEFRRAVALLVEHLPRGFDFDVNVSLFETTIRLLGGLLSAHLFAIDDRLEIYPLYRQKVPYYINPSEIGRSTGNGNSNLLFGDSKLSKDSVEYGDELLILAIDLGNRLMPAFNTKTGIPYGTVNLRNGVPKGETKISSTAGSGSLFVEFHVLSILADEEKYGYAAFKALKGLYDRRSPVDLVGKHINIESGQWQETMSGVGSNSDSFFEYHLKTYAMLHGAQPLYKYYNQLYQAVKKYILPDDAWFCEVEMYTGRFSRYRIENLDAFWPGLEVAMGKMSSSARQLQALYSVWLDLGFLPEELDLNQWKTGKGPSNALYPLRPELIEATVYHYQATKDRSWLAGGKLILESIQNYTRTGCGFASIFNIMNIELADEMPSFFLSETVKYLYLLFDENHFLHHRSVIFSTEAHPFDLLQLRKIEKERASERASGGYSVYNSDYLPHEAMFLVNPPPITENNNADDFGSNDDTSSRSRKKKTTELSSLYKRKSNTKRHSVANGRPQSSKGRKKHLKYEDGREEEVISDNAYHSCKLQKWWEVPKSLQWTTEDIASATSFASTSSVSKFVSTSARQESSPSRDPSVTNQINRRLNRQSRSMQLMQRLVVHYYDVYEVSEEDRPLSVIYLMQLMNEEAGEVFGSTNVPSSSSSMKSTTNKAKQKFTEKQNSISSKCPLSAEASAEESVSLEALEQELLQLQHSNPSAAQEKIRELAKKHMAGPGMGGVGEEKPLKAVELTLGNLGNFGVQVFADAFRITHQRDSFTLDIANLGRKSIFVRQFSPIPQTTSSADSSSSSTDSSSSSSSSSRDKKAPIQYEVQAIAANQNAYHSTCHVELIQRSSREDPHKSPTVLLKLPCSMSTFSKNRPHIVEADLSIPSSQYDSYLCRKAVSISDPKKSSPSPTSSSPSSSSSASTATTDLKSSGKIASATRTAMDDISSLRQWFRNKFLSSAGQSREKQPSASTAHDHTSSPSSTSSSSSSSSSSSTKTEMTGSIVLADRGQCLFEDKAEIAERAGAIGLILKNNENTLFMMAGKKEVELINNPGAASVETMSLPVVMLMDAHASQLVTIYRQYHSIFEATNNVDAMLKVRIVIEEENSLLLSPVFGEQEYPKVWSTKQTIFVQGPARWGAFFQAKEASSTAAGSDNKQQQQQPPQQQQQQDWQMFLVDLKDQQAHKLLPPGVVKSPNGHKMTTYTASLMMSPGEVYRHYIHRSCPSNVISVNSENKRDVRLHRRRIGVSSDIDEETN